MKIQALDIQIGERIVAYCNQKMQICTVRQILDLNLDNITLLVSISGLPKLGFTRSPVPTGHFG